MLSLIADNVEYKVDWITFSDGAITCKIDPSIPKKNGYIAVTVCPTTPVSMVVEELNLLVDALASMDVDENQFVLNVDYFPYGRADRIFEKGNPSPLACFCAELKCFGFNNIYTCDIHNEDCNAINDLKDEGVRFKSKSQLQCFIETGKWLDRKYDYVVAPDKGAVEKAGRIAEMLNAKLVTATKVRDVSTGRITSIEFNGGVPENASVVICDDILDGGGTFVPLAEKLYYNSCTVDLYVTHLIGARGLQLFRPYIDKIFCYHTVGSYVNKGDVLNYNLGKIVK